MLQFSHLQSCCVTILIFFTLILYGASFSLQNAHTKHIKLQRFWNWNWNAGECSFQKQYSLFALRHKVEFFLFVGKTLCGNWIVSWVNYKFFHKARAFWKLSHCIVQCEYEIQKQWYVVEVSLLQRLSNAHEFTHSRAIWFELLKEIVAKVTQC